MVDEQEKLAALDIRANKLGHQIELSVKALGYCLWRSLPGVGRYMVLRGNDNDGVTLDAIAQKLDEIEARNDAVPARPVAVPQSSPRGGDDQEKTCDPSPRKPSAAVTVLYDGRRYDDEEAEAAAARRASAADRSCRRRSGRKMNR